MDVKILLSFLKMATDNVPHSITETIDLSNSHALMKWCIKDWFNTIIQSVAVPKHDEPIIQRAAMSRI